MLNTRWTEAQRGATVGELLRAVNPWHAEAPLLTDYHHTDLEIIDTTAPLQEYDMQRIAVALERQHVRLAYHASFTRGLLLVAEYK